MKKLMILLVLLGLSLAACSSPSAVTPAPAAPTKAVPTEAASATAAATNAAQAADDLTQISDEAAVIVAVTPLNFADQSAATLDFDIALNTHSVDLSYDLKQIATLSSDAGEEVQPTQWNGPTGGGHHREGTLSFPQLTQRGQTLTLTLRGIADVPERTFTWRVN
jgi:hypothetical protein